MSEKLFNRSRLDWKYNKGYGSADWWSLEGYTGKEAIPFQYDYISESLTIIDKGYGEELSLLCGPEQAEQIALAIMNKLPDPLQAYEKATELFNEQPKGQGYSHEQIFEKVLKGDL